MRTFYDKQLRNPSRSTSTNTKMSAARQFFAIRSKSNRTFDGRLARMGRVGEWVGGWVNIGHIATADVEAARKSCNILCIIPRRLDEANLR